MPRPRRGINPRNISIHIQLRHSLEISSARQPLSCWQPVFRPPARACHGGSKEIAQTRCQINLRAARHVAGWSFPPSQEIGQTSHFRASGTFVANAISASGESVAALNLNRKHSHRSVVMEMESLQDLFVEELKDLYSAENQILKAGPKMSKAIENEDLKAAIDEHLKITE
jgi:hypothetical protein